MPAVTVIMPAYQAAATIAPAIESVRRQTWQDWELIVVDDASRDGTGEVARAAAAGDPRVQVLRNGENLGAATSMNRAWKGTASRYVAILDADDIAMPERLEVQVGRMDQDRVVSVLGAGAHVVDQAGNFLRTTQLPAEDDLLRRRRWYACPFVHSTVLMRREFLNRTGGYTDGLRLGEDSDLWMRGFLEQGVQYANLQTALVTYRSRPVQRWAMIKAGAKVRRIAGRREKRWWRGELAAVRIIAEGLVEQTGVFAWRDRRRAQARPAVSVAGLDRYAGT